MRRRRRLFDRLAGGFAREPEELTISLSRTARDLLERARSGLSSGGVPDVHVHVAGTGSSGSGISLHPAMLDWRHPLRRLRFLAFVSAAGIDDLSQADRQYFERLLRLVRALPPGLGPGATARYHLLAFDRRHRHDGAVDLERTEMHIPNEYVFALAEAHPDLFAPTMSIHPYRQDALDELQRWASHGGRMLKWLPNAMGIDPSDPRLDHFYEAMRRLGVVLITHAGHEAALASGADQSLGNPLLLRRPLDHGLTVVVAHCASLGRQPDLDRPDRPFASSLSLFLRLMDTPRYRGRLFGALSATTFINRVPQALATLLERRDLHPWLVNGSDYPMPGLRVVLATGKLARAGFVTRPERAALDEVYDFNPLLFDLLVKRTVRHPVTGVGFAAEAFAARQW